MSPPKKDGRPGRGKSKKGIKESEERQSKKSDTKLEKDKKKVKGKKSAEEDKAIKRQSESQEENDDEKDHRKESVKSEKEKKEKQKGKKHSADVEKTSDEEDKGKAKRHLAKRRSDDDEFRWQLDVESSEGRQIDSYDAEDLLKQLPAHQWLITPSIKWTIFRENEEKVRLLRLELEAIEAANALLEDETKEEGQNQGMELVALDKRCDPAPSCLPNPCPCKASKRKRTLPPEVCEEEEPQGISAEDRCWEEYQERQREASKMRWFASVLVSAHKRRPSWIPPPEECLRLQHKMLQEQTILTKLEEEGGAEVAEHVAVEATPDVLPVTEPQKSNDPVKDDGEKTHKSKRGNAPVTIKKPLQQKGSKKLSK